MNTKIIALLAVAAIILAFVFLGGSQDVNAPADITSENDTTEVSDDAPVTEEGSSEEAPTEASAPAPATPVTSSAPAPTPKPSPAPAPVATTNYPTTAVVVYNGSSFSPREVTIIEGGSVTFINQSDDVKMWVASDNHPSHTRYPLKSDDNCLGSNFDQCTAVSQYGRWTFVFERFGQWDYHNHVRAKDGGTVNVYTKEEYDKLMPQS